mmetsp:Transcript_40025/g.103593  ORF Transcript_40025/g.103593 Transcript_40025/m.103593 type:complete len:162 (+) Transcript_40025:1091-1576(+)
MCMGGWVERGGRERGDSVSVSKRVRRGRERIGRDKMMYICKRTHAFLLFLSPSLSLSLFLSPSLPPTFTHTHITYTPCTMQISIHGYGFCKGAKEGFFLVLRNIARVGVVGIIGNFVVLLGKIIIGAATGLLVYVYFEYIIRIEETPVFVVVVSVHMPKLC